MCARDVHNLTKRAQVRQWGGRPSFFLPSHHVFLPPFSPSLSQPLGVLQMQGFVSVPNRRSIIPPQKCSKRDLSPRQTRQQDGTVKINHGDGVKDSEYSKSSFHQRMSKCGWGGLNCSPSLLSWEPCLSVTQTTSYAWLASGRMNTDAIKPTHCSANTHWQAFRQSSVCVTVTGERSCELCTLQSLVCLTHTAGLAPVKPSAAPLHPGVRSLCVWIHNNS